jgi:predicted ATPase
VAEALGFRFYEEGQPRQQLLDYLREKNMLLIMDNFEHLVEGAGLVTEILHTAPEVKILATSRARLNVGGEHLFTVAGMSFPTLETQVDATGYSAVKLFLSSVRRIQPSFEPTADELTEVVRICRLVEGMPLGILLAAAWTEILTPSEIAAEIGRGLDFLKTDLRDLPERQRSLRAVFDHSWNLLLEQERKVFQRLSVFRGGFTRDAAHKVTGASLPDLMGLLNKSLLYRSARGRYEAHELLKQYAAEKLDRSPAASQAARDQHSAYYLAALRDWETDLKGARQQIALAELEADFENARAAWNWALDRGRVEHLEQAIYSLFAFYGWRMRLQEGEAACRKAASRLAAVEKIVRLRFSTGDMPRMLAQILSFQSWYNRLQGRTEVCAQLMQRSLALLERAESDGQDIRSAKAYILLEMGDVESESNRKQARRLYEQVLGLFRVLGDRWGMSKTLHSLGWLAWNLGAFSEAKQFYEESLAVRRELGDQKGIAESLYGLSRVALRQGPFDEGERLVKESLAICDEIGDRIGVANGLRSLGGILLQCGKYVEAQEPLEESATIYKDLGMRHYFILSNYALCVASMAQGHYERARIQGQMYLALAQEIGYQRGIAGCYYVLGCIELAVAGYAEAHRMLQESITVLRDIGQRDELSWSLAGLGYAARGLGNIPQARQYLSEALRIAIEIWAFTPLMLALPAIALLLADQGEEELAVELYTLASRYQFVANSCWMQDIAGHHIATIGATLPPEVVAAAQERGQTRDPEATAAELLAELAD